MLNEYQIMQEMGKRGYICDKLTNKYIRYYNQEKDRHVLIFKNGKYTKRNLKVLTE